MIKKVSLYAVLGCLFLGLPGESCAFKLPKQIAAPLEQTSEGNAGLKAKVSQVISSYDTAKAIYDNAVLNAAFLLAPAETKPGISANDIPAAEAIITAAGQDKQIAQQLASMSKEDKKHIGEYTQNIIHEMLVKNKPLTQN